MHNGHIRWENHYNQILIIMNKLFLLILTLLSTMSCTHKDEKPIVLRTMGSLFFGGTVTETSDGETVHGDHGYAQYFVPLESRNYPLILWHGIGQSGKSFETTIDGREGYMSMLPRRNWSVYIIDQPRRGRAGLTAAQADTNSLVPSVMPESGAWAAFRNGTWNKDGNPTLFERLQMPQSPQAYDQFFRQQTPNTGEEPRTKAHRDFMGQTMGRLLERIGPAILVTHSNSGQYGWAAGMFVPDSLKAIVAYEPASCVFPESDVPKDTDLSPIASLNKILEPQVAPDDEFKNLTRMPILIVFGDNIPEAPHEHFNYEAWRLSLHRAKQFVETVNRLGGDAKLQILPEIGIYGNTHAPFADLNNQEIADLLEQFLKEKGLDGMDKPHKGLRFDNN